MSWLFWLAIDKDSRSTGAERRYCRLRTWNLLGEYFPYGTIGDALALVRMSRRSSGAAWENRR
jgi:hypothetical protein